VPEGRQREGGDAKLWGALVLSTEIWK
jgi:hypothetical protein